MLGMKKQGLGLGLLHPKGPVQVEMLDAVEWLQLAGLQHYSGERIRDH